MVEHTSLRKLNLAGPDLVTRIVSQGFTPNNYHNFTEQIGRAPTYRELVAPSHLLVDLESDLETHGQLSDLYPVIGRNLTQDLLFYFRNCPGWLHFQTAQKEKSLTQVVKTSIEELNRPRKKNQKKSYMFGLDIWTTSPSKYQRPEIVEEKKTLPSKKDRQGMYVTSLDWSQLTFEQASCAFRSIYNQLSKKKLEVHNNSSHLHQEVKDLEEAVQLVAEGKAIAKIDTPRINVYLKPNSTYHVRVDLLGTQEEIFKMVKEIEEIARELYSKQKVEHHFP